MNLEKLSTYESNQLLNSDEFDWFNPSMYKRVVELGFRNVEWNEIPDELLLYLFLHDEPSLGSKRKETTKKEYFREAKQFMDYVFQTSGSIRSLHHEDVQNYQLQLEQQGYKSTTLRRKSVVIQQFLSYLVNKGIIDDDLTKSMKRISVKKETLVNRDFYDTEVQALLDYYQEEDYFMYTLLYVLISTGLRIQELADAKWGNVFYQPEVGLYFLTVVGKRDKAREVPIFEDVLEVIKEFRMRRRFTGELKNDGTPFFPKASGQHYSFKYLSQKFSNEILSLQGQFEFINQRVQREEAMKEEGHNIKYRITPHTCRHYTASYFLSKGADQKAVQDLLGHESSSTTDGYLRRKRKFEEHAAVKVGKTFMSH
ncbi:tyrosine-type recombinase/integrase [Pontibacillus yanchengensis]|nr:tyrosine-type recombinase/integrase [Pontibacillus yanchengensis]